MANFLNLALLSKTRYRQFIYFIFLHPSKDVLDAWFIRNPKNVSEAVFS